MNRLAVLLVPVLLAACDRPAPQRQPEPQPVPKAAFDNAVAPRSIIQPEIAAANPPEPEPDPSPTPPLPPNSLTVPFERGATLTAGARAALDGFVAAIPPVARLVVRGHSDSPGSDRANLLQSRRRAEAVRDYLIARDIATDRIAVVALGERRPVAPNAHLDGSDDPAGRARNRRVDIEVLPERPLPAIPQPGASAD